MPVRTLQQKKARRIKFRCIAGLFLRAVITASVCATAPPPDLRRSNFLNPPDESAAGRALRAVGRPSLSECGGTPILQLQLGCTMTSRPFSPLLATTPECNKPNK